jgi:hypothetical protein
MSDSSRPATREPLLELPPVVDTVPPPYPPPLLTAEDFAHIRPTPQASSWLSRLRGLIRSLARRLFVTFRIPHRLFKLIAFIAFAMIGPVALLISPIAALFAAAVGMTELLMSRLWQARFA